MSTQSVVCNLKNTATVSCHPQTGVQSKYKFYICQRICKLNMKMVVLNFTQWNSKSSKIISNALTLSDGYQVPYPMNFPLLRTYLRNTICGAIYH